MENRSFDQTSNVVDDGLWRIESVADWLRHEAKSLAGPPPEPEKRDVSVRRYKMPADMTLHRRSQLILRDI
jgi:hypothetical protein